MAVWGGVGWVLDRWLETRFFLPVGILLGVAVAIYVVAVKFGAFDPLPGSEEASSTQGGRRSPPGRTQKGRR
ncbi:MULTISPECIES: AtpZ/AtpI family protein [unclassified Blastococcus]